MFLVNLETFRLLEPFRDRVINSNSLSKNLIVKID